MNVTVGVPTYQRNDQLAVLLRALDGCQKPPDCDVRLLVVDNNPDGRARAVVDAVVLRTSVRYVHEPARGFATVRNRILREANGSDFLAMIDDDELPGGPEWLVELVAACQGAAAATSYVAYTLPREPSWAVGSGVFTPHLAQHGEAVEVASTNNLIVSLAELRRLGVTRFDAAYNQSGGEDSDFTYRISAAGGRIVWIDSAPVRETIPAERVTHRWIARRVFRTGVTDGGIERRRRSRLAVIAFAVRHVLAGGLRMCKATLARSGVEFWRGAYTIVRGVGIASTAVR